MNKAQTEPGSLISIDLIVNGEKMRATAETLQTLLLELGYQTAGVATAINNEFVPKPAHSKTLLNAGDQIEIVSARQGG